MAGMSEPPPLVTGTGPPVLAGAAGSSRQAQERSGGVREPGGEQPDTPAELG
jgi:hypothetical protein